ncbi:DNA polymerase III, beta subunit [Plesiocystis pacifica SIR-1]|uniref:Beta sliding clamp n=1 Tax=Plesiocystis pacifica SIR-1 TaxID=391625 RepID=A6G5S7_9BACT|nr:DNA polymerase III subunit beta [Plesiocystis pacifica]EDM78858.1 DNA polymerase III, beta subunit [Plesiocystis pacifica SIR-1]
MEFEIDQARFLSALTLASTVADRRSTMPVLANVLLRATTDDELVCCATDMMIALTEKVPCKVSNPGSLTLGVRHLQSVVRTLPSGALRIKSLDNSWAQILAKRSEFKLMGMPEGDFPELPDASGESFTTVPAHKLVNLIEKTLFSVSTDEARINLNGAMLESDGQTATMVSTDGHRLTKFSLELEGLALPREIIVPRKGMDEIRKVLNRVEGEVGIAVSDQYLFVEAEKLTLSVKLNNVTFPPWKQVVPKDFQRRAGVERTELIGALRQAAVIAPEKTATVKVQLDKGSLRLNADNPELGAINLELPVDYDGSPLTAGFNANYLIEALGALSADRIYLDFQGELDPCVLRPAPDDEGNDPVDFLAVVMPMRI